MGSESGGKFLKIKHKTTNFPEFLSATIKINILERSTNPLKTGQWKGTYISQKGILDQFFSIEDKLSSLENVKLV